MKRLLLILLFPTILLADIERVNEDITLPYWPDYILSGDPNELNEYFQILIKTIETIQDELKTVVNLGVDLDDTDVRYFGTKDTDGNYANDDWRIIKVSADDFELQKMISSTWTQMSKWSEVDGFEFLDELRDSSSDFLVDAANITGAVNITASGTITGGTLTDGTATITGGIVTATTLTDGTFTTTGGTTSTTTLTLTGLTQNSIVFAGSGGLLSEDTSNFTWTDSSDTLLAAGMTVTPSTFDFQPTTDSTTAFQVSDADGGTSVFNIDTTNERVGIGQDDPTNALHVSGTQGITVDSTVAIGLDMSGGTFATVAIKASTIDTTAIENTAGDLALQASAAGLVDVFEDGVVGNAVDGKIFRIWRNAAELKSSIDIWTDQYKVPHIQSSSVGKWFKIFAAGPGDEAQLVIGNDQQGVFFVGGDSADSELLAISNNMIFGWERTSGTAVYHTITFRGEDDDGFHPYFDVTGGVGSRVTNFYSESTIFQSGTPYVTFLNTTSEDADGGRESRLNFKGRQSGDEETTLARIEVSHDGAADDEKGKIVFSTNDGSDTDTPTERLKIDSAGVFTLTPDADTDLIVNFIGTTNSGILTWMEDEDYFKFGDEILMDTAEKINLRDTAIGMYSQADTFMDLFADGGVRIGDSSGGAPTNFTIIEPDGTVEFNGNATVWNDINVGAVMLALPAAGLPDEDEFVDEAGADTGIATWAYAIGEKSSGTLELEHFYKEGSDIYFHIHWQGITVPAGGTDNVNWQLTYTVGQLDETLDAPTTITKEIAIDTQYDFKSSDFAAITGTNFNIGDQFLFTIERIAASADDYAGDCLVATVGLHVECDTTGSRAITTK